MIISETGEVESLMGDDLAEVATRQWEVKPYYWEANYFYGIASCLKQYAGLPEDFQIHAAIHHGPYLQLNCGAGDIGDFGAPFQFHICCSRLIARRYANMIDRMLFPVGPYIRYAEPSRKPHEIKELKKKLGRSLLVFPTHSLEHIDVNFDIGLFCDRIEAIASSFESVVVCLYWKDVLRGCAKPYIERGFQVETAGNIRYTGFLSRLSTILHLGDAVFTNGIGTHMGYATSFNLPVLYEPGRDVSYSVAVNSPDHAQQELNQQLALRSRFGRLEGGPDHRQLLGVFQRNTDFQISLEQRAIVELMWGERSHRTTEELRDLLLLVNDCSQGMKSGRVYAFVKQKIAKAINEGKYSTSLDLIENARDCRMDDLSYLRAEAESLLRKPNSVNSSEIIELATRCLSDSNYLTDFKIKSRHLTAINADSSSQLIDSPTGTKNLLNLLIYALAQSDYHGYQRVLAEIAQVQTDGRLVGLCSQIASLVFNESTVVQDQTAGEGSGPGSETLTCVTIELIGMLSLTTESVQTICCELIASERDELCQR